MTQHELRKRVLLARCELDRHELAGEVQAARERVHRGVSAVGRAAPWFLVATPIAGLLLGKSLRVRPMAALGRMARLAMEFRVVLPLVKAFLNPRRPGS